MLSQRPFFCSNLPDRFTINSSTMWSVYIEIKPVLECTNICLLYWSIVWFAQQAKVGFSFFLPWILQIRNLHSHWCAESSLSFVFGSSVCSHLSCPWGFSCIPKKVHGGFLPCSEFDTKIAPKLFQWFSVTEKNTICLAYILQKRQGFRVDDAKDSRLGSFN